MTKWKCMMQDPQGPMTKSQFKTHDPYIVTQIRFNIQGLCNAMAKRQIQDSRSTGPLRSRYSRITPAPHGCVFHEECCVPSRCVKTRFRYHMLCCDILCFAMKIELNHTVSNSVSQYPNQNIGENRNYYHDAS